MGRIDILDWIGLDRIDHDHDHEYEYRDAEYEYGKKHELSTGLAITSSVP